MTIKDTRIELITTKIKILEEEKERITAQWEICNEDMEWLELQDNASIKKLHEIASRMTIFAHEITYLSNKIRKIIEVLSN